MSGFAAGYAIGSAIANQMRINDLENEVHSSSNYSTWEKKKSWPHEDEYKCMTIVRNNDGYDIAAFADREMAVKFAKLKEYDEKNMILRVVKFGG